MVRDLQIWSDQSCQQNILTKSRPDRRRPAHDMIQLMETSMALSPVIPMAAGLKLQACQA